MATDEELPDVINAEPTKGFFVDMLVRDIPSERAVLDLVDNCIDGAKRIRKSDYNGLNVKIELNSERFRIVDNCGGFSKQTARDYAFRFGRPPGTPATSGSIGQFGVGMKRALFKFGRHFVVRSATPEDCWAVDVDVEEWEKKSNDWYFKWANFDGNSEISKKSPGTEIIVNKLKPEFSSQFNNPLFINEVSGLIKSQHRQFISMGLGISVNGTHLDATSVYLLIANDLHPGVDTLSFGNTKADTVKVRIQVGIGESVPRDAGWYVICNGRVVLERHRGPETGWGLVEKAQGRAVIPSFHNQFARFRGIVSFDCPDAARLPWNTTKTGVNADNPVWKKTFQRMAEMMRPVIDFLNELDNDIDEFTRDESALYQYVKKASVQKAETLTRRSEFRAPQREKLKKVQRTIKVQYSKPVKDVSYLQDKLGVNSATAVGQRTFDLILKQQRGQ